MQKRFVLSVSSVFPKAWIVKAIQLYHLLRAAQTLGVRCVAQDEAGRILLVRHNYLTGWYLPGGGVEAGETISVAARRELEEETGFAATEMELLGLYLNRRGLGRDHVGLYRMTACRKVRDVVVPNREIAEIGFFAPGDLPPDVTPATRRRLAEVFEGVEASEEW